jgi:hypothetical protein
VNELGKRRSSELKARPIAREFHGSSELKHAQSGVNFMGEGGSNVV